MPYKDPEKQREYQRKWRAKRRAEWFEDKSCAMCGITNVPMDLDHIDTNAKVSHKIWSWAEDKRNKELEKCQVLCEPCHAIKTNEDLKRGNPEHGTYARYQTGCQCLLCIEAKRVYNREWMRKNRSSKN